MQPSGAATPRDSDTHKRIAVPKALCVLRKYIQPRPKSGKVCRSTPGPGMFVNVQYVSRVVIAAPSGRPLFRRVCHCVRFFEQSRVYTTFTRESERGPFVREVEKRDEKQFGTALWR